MRMVLATGVAALVACAAQAQHAADYEAPTYTGSPTGTIITGQDGFYVPVPESQDGLVYSYSLNALGLPQNPNGGEQFVAVTGGDVALPQPFARAQRDMTYGDGTGQWSACFDIAATYTGVLPSAQNIGSLSTQAFAAPNPSEQTFIALARWTDPVTAENWNADYVWFDAAGAQFTEVVPNPAFQGLAVDHWYRWCTTFDLDTNAILEVSITDLTTGDTTTQAISDRYMFGGTTGSATGPPTGFRYFGGTNAAGAEGNTLAFDNLDVAEATPSSCTGDTNGDGTVNVSDLVNVITLWGTDGQEPGIDADTDDDGIVGVGDLTDVILNWGDC